ncbi:hypothetical protein J6590_088916 [Homalodisca vitripennis]|nr:hypothetical protein J6590_088916 [Homalodisca vitripennis]
MFNQLSPIALNGFYVHSNRYEIRTVTLNKNMLPGNTYEIRTVTLSEDRFPSKQVQDSDCRSERR